MGGANYMGGKRNAVKARSKDATARAQRGFFGRQRLEILAKGLGTTRSPIDATGKPKGDRGMRSEIELTHARRDRDVQRHHDQSEVAEYVSPAKAYVGTTKTKEGSSTGMQLGQNGGSYKQHSSRVLTALDTSEPLSMRAEMARILALPDFAGLSQPYSKISPSHLPSFHTVLKRRRSASSDSPQVHSKQRLRYTDDSDSTDYTDKCTQDTSPIENRKVGQHAGCVSLPTSTKYPHNSQLLRMDQKILSLVPESTTTLNPMVDARELPRRSPSSTLYQEDYSDDDNQHIPFNSNIDQNDSQYAEFTSEEELQLPAALGESEKFVLETALGNTSGQPSSPSDRLHSTMLDSGTSPLPGSSGSFEDIMSQSPMSTSSLRSYLSDFSDVPPQPLNVYSLPMTPFHYSKLARHQRENLPLTEIEMPSSPALEPPLTFCLPSPKNKNAISPTELLNYHESPPHTVRPQLSSISPGSTSRKLDLDIGSNILDEPDPWSAIGKLLNLEPT